MGETHNAFQWPVLSFSSCFLPFLSRISGNSEKKIVFQAIEKLLQSTVSEIHFLSLRYMITRISKNFEQLSISIQAIQGSSVLVWCKQLTSKSFQTSLYCVYLLKLYDKWIIILLTNDLTNIFSEISKILLILSMVYTCNVKG